MIKGTKESGKNGREPQLKWADLEICKTMKIDGVVYGGLRATALPTLLLGHGRARLRCSASYPPPGKPKMFYIYLSVDYFYNVY